MGACWTLRLEILFKCFRVIHALTFSWKSHFFAFGELACGRRNVNFANRPEAASDSCRPELQRDSVSPGRSDQSWDSESSVWPVDAERRVTGCCRCCRSERDTRAPGSTGLSGSSITCWTPAPLALSSARAVCCDQTSSLDQTLRPHRLTEITRHQDACFMKTKWTTHVKHGLMPSVLPYSHIKICCLVRCVYEEGTAGKAVIFIRFSFITPFLRVDGYRKLANLHASFDIPFEIFISANTVQTFI